MNNRKKLITVLFSVLFILCLIFPVNSLDRFSVQRIKYVFKHTKSIDEIKSGKSVYYRISDKSSNLLGYAYFGSEKGYAGPVKCLICLDNEKKINKVIAYEAKKETPEIAGKCLKESWLDQFIGLDCSNVPYNKYEFDGCGIDDVSGATITSAAVLECIIQAVETDYEGE